MTAEVMDQTLIDSLPEAESLEIVLLAILERHDGLCLDNELERTRLAAALAAALLATADVMEINQPVPPRGPVLSNSLPQTTGSSVSTPLPG